MADQTIARALLPRLIAFVTNTAPEDPESARSLVTHTLCQYVATLSKDHVTIAMALILPTLLSRASSEEEAESSGVYRETSSMLLTLASVDQAAFRAVVGAMSEAQKSFMEAVIKSGRQAGGGSGAAGQRGGADDGGSGQPTIALKMNFGG